MRVVTNTASMSGMTLQAKLMFAPASRTLFWGVNPPPDDPTALHCGPIKTGYEQLQTMGSNKVAVPETTNDREVAIEWLKTNPNVWGRANFHTQGRDIVRPNNKLWTERDFWVKQIPSDAIKAEWRLHVFAGKSIARGRKTQVEILSRKLAPFVRSRRNGWRLEHTNQPPQGAKHYAKLAVQSLGYLWGAVDMLEIDLEKLPEGIVTNHARLRTNLDKNGLNPFVVLEVNQKPGMDDYTADKYAGAIMTYVDSLPAVVDGAVLSASGESGIPVVS